MLREFWPPVPVCALPDLWEKTASGCASHAKNSHTSFSFILQPCCIALIQVMSVLAPIIQKEIGGERAAVWVQMGHLAQPCLQLKARAAVSAKAGTRQHPQHFPFGLPLQRGRHIWTNVLSSVWFVQSVACSGSHALPAPPWAPFSFWPTQHPQVRDSPGLTCCTRHQLLIWAWLWLPAFETSWIFVLEKTEFFQCVCASDDFLC